MRDDDTTHPTSPMRRSVDTLHELKQLVLEGPSPEATERQHAKGKLTARERIAVLLDKGSFQEVEALRRHRATGFGLEGNRPHTDGGITGWGGVEGRTVITPSDRKSTRLNSSH